MKRISMVVALVLICSCGHNEEISRVSRCVVSLKPLNRVDASGAPTGDLQVKWASGDVLLLSTDASDSPETVTVSQDMISGEGLVVNVSAFSGNLCFAKVPMTGTGAPGTGIKPVYDGSLKSVYFAAGDSREGETAATLKPQLGALEFSVSKTGVYAIRLNAESDIFPEAVDFDSKTGEFIVKAALSSVTIDALSPVRLFVPIAPGGNISGCTIEFLNEHGQTMASGSCDAAVPVPSGTSLNLGQVDAGVDFPSQGTDLTAGMDDAAAIMITGKSWCRR